MVLTYEMAMALGANVPETVDEVPTYICYYLNSTPTSPHRQGPNDSVSHTVI